jgi:hypothetical protein
MDLDNAILAHHVWKNHLKSVIAAKGSLNAAQVARDDCCEIGRWLYGDGGVLYGKTPEFGVLLDKHRQFHLEAGKVADVINAGEHALASRLIEGGTPFGMASLAVGMAVKELKRIAD